MPMLAVFDGTRNIERDVDGIVFDKDGTLIDFNRAWWGRLERSIGALRGLVAQRGLITEAAHWEKVARADAIQAALYATLGGHAATGSLVTVALTPDTAAKLVHGIQTGTLYAGLRGTDTKANLAQIVSDATLFRK